MSDVGKREKQTQDRVVRLFRDALGYSYLGNWIDRDCNSNIEPELLRNWLKKRVYDSGIISRAMHHLDKIANDTSKTLYERNRDVYEALRYGVKVKPEMGVNTQTVWLVDWEHPENNDFAIAEEVTIPAKDSKGNTKRPDIVLYVNGIALGVLELKRSTVSVSEGIRQNLANQKKEFIEYFFSTQQLVMAGNDTQGLRYGTIQTPEKYYLTWKEDGPEENLLDRHLCQICRKDRFLELIHDFIVFDSGVKKVCRHNQYFGVKAAQRFVKRREGGIIWHTQGSGKSLTMVWLAKWIRENTHDARVLIITDRTELDDQIEKVFYGVSEDIYRTKSGADLIRVLNDTTPWLMCSLIHKFGSKGREESDIADYVEEVRNAIPTDFSPKGNMYVFVDECHRTQSGELHRAMKAILPNAVFIGFTGTPLLRSDKKRSIEIFGPYIHTYKFDEAVRDGVVVDLRYEARDIDQSITSQKKIDEWFEAKTRGLTDLAKAQLKQRWGTLQKVLSSRERLAKIVADILMDMSTRPRLMDGRGNALLVAGSIYEACKFYELFMSTGLAGKCAIVTSYNPSPSDIKGEETGEGYTEQLNQYRTYQKMLSDWFDEAPEEAIRRTDEFEKQVKKMFVDEPGQMRLLIVVDKLLTGFDAPSATYLYIDKNMRDHGLFQAICRVNRLDGDDKEYGYIIDYKDLFKSLEGAVRDYTSAAFDGYDEEDVAGLLEDRVDKARERLEETGEAIKALCEPVDPPRNTAAYLRYFCAEESGNAEQLKNNEPKRLSLYTCAAAYARAYASIANEMDAAGYSADEIAAIRAEVDHFRKASEEVKLASGDYIDLKLYEPAMRHLIDTYIRAEESEKLSAFDDMSLIDLIIARSPDVIDALPEGIRSDKNAAAETIENNVRKLIIDEHPINPKYYDRMSELLDALIEQRKKEAMSYREYLEQIRELTARAKNPHTETSYPAELDTKAKRALFDNFGRNVELALKLDHAVRGSIQDDWRSTIFKVRRVRAAIQEVLGEDETLVDQVLELVKKQNDY